MTAKQTILPDATLRQALHELAAGPAETGLTSDVLAAVATIPQVRASAWPTLTTGRRVPMILVAGLLLTALVSSLALLAGLLPHPVPTPFSPSTIVVQSGGPIFGTAEVSQVAFAPGAAAGTAFNRLPTAAAEPRWSPDGTRVAYFVWGPPIEPNANEPYLPPGQITGLYVANGDGTEPIEAEVPWVVPPYGLAGGWESGAQWAPSGEWFHLSLWAGHQVYDLYDATGVYLWRLELDPLSWGRAVWSPDGSSIGWIGETCADGSCESRAFNWQPVSGVGEVQSVALEPVPDDRTLFTVTWTGDNRLLFVEHRATGGTLGPTGWRGYDFDTAVVRSFSMALDGTDVREVPAVVDGQPDQVPSPDGRRLATWDPDAEAVVIKDVESGEDTAVPVPGAFMIVGWSPGGDRLALAGPTDSNVDPYTFFVVDADGSALQSVGLGSSLAWMPAGPLGQDD